MVPAFNNRRNTFVSFLAVMLSFSALLLIIVPLPGFADRIVAIRQYTTLTIGCDINNNDKDFIDTTKVLTYDQQAKLTLKCERTGGDIDLKKGESITLRCLHDNPLTIPKHVKMKAGELFYVLCNAR